MKANDCFAMSKNSAFTLQKNRADAPDRISCYVLHDNAFRKMRMHGFCGTEMCPFYKKARSEIRLD